MKRSLRLLLLAALLLLPACSREDRLPEIGAEASLRFEASHESSPVRTALSADGRILWSQDDSISVFTAAGVSRIFSDVLVSEGGYHASFSGTIPLSATYRALCPADPGARFSNDTLYTTLPAVQRAVANGFDPAAALSVAVTGSEELYFRNAVSLLGIVIRNRDIRSVEFSATGASGTFPAGSCAIFAGGALPEAKSLSGSRTVTLSGDFENDEVYYLAVLPGTYSDLQFVFTDAAGRRATLSNKKPLTALRGEMTDVIDRTIAESEWVSPMPPAPGADYGWPELPAQTDLDRNGIDDNDPDLYYSHTFRADAASIRSYSSCYSAGKLHPVWVAAPMHACYLGSSGRNDSYRNDPLLGCLQSPKFPGYTRGHMVGSSDRTVSVATNKQTFYYSNIGAQLQAGFNTGGGAWNNLESKTDSFLCADTLYQVIGCIFTSLTDRYGNKVSPSTGTNSVGTFQVPTAWYKVLLRTKAGNTGKRVTDCSASELQCAAFILAHRSNASHKPTADDLYSVAELEKLTGLTYFVNVPSAPKTVCNASDWGL